MMATLYHQVWINAPTGRVYEAVSTENGVGSWWDRPRTVASDDGLVLEFRPGAEHGVLRMKVLEMVQGRRVEWQCISTHPKSSPASAWTGTHVLLKSRRGSEARSSISATPAGTTAASIWASATINGAWLCRRSNDGVNRHQPRERGGWPRQGRGVRPPRPSPPRTPARTRERAAF